MEPSMDPGTSPVGAAADIGRIHPISQQLTSFCRQHWRKQDVLYALSPFYPLEKDGMLAGMVWGQLCKDKTAKHSKQEEISRVQLTMLIEGLTISPALGSPEARDGWYVAMDVDRNCLGGEVFRWSPCFIQLETDFGRRAITVMRWGRKARTLSSHGLNGIRKTRKHNTPRVP